MDVSGHEENIMSADEIERTKMNHFFNIILRTFIHPQTISYKVRFFILLGGGKKGWCRIFTKKLCPRLYFWDKRYAQSLEEQLSTDR